MEEKKLKVRVIDWAMVAAIAAILALAVGVYQARYKSYNISAGSTIQCNYSKSKSNTATGTLKPSKGTLYYGWAQTAGNKTCKYTLSYKKVSSKSYKILRSKKNFVKNNSYFGDYKIGKVNGKTNYNMKCVKIAGAKTKSTVKIDWLIK